MVKRQKQFLCEFINDTQLYVVYIKLWTNCLVANLFDERIKWSGTRGFLSCFRFNRSRPGIVSNFRKFLYSRQEILCQSEFFRVIKRAHFSAIPYLAKRMDAFSIVNGLPLVDARRSHTPNHLLRPPTIDNRFSLKRSAKIPENTKNLYCLLFFHKSVSETTPSSRWIKYLIISSRGKNPIFPTSKRQSLEYRIFFNST